MKRFFTFIAVVFLSANLFAQTDVTFNVNMNDSISSGYFVVETDVVYMSGTAVGGWAEPGTNASNMMADEDGDGIYTLTVTGLVDGSYEYKYFKNSSWDNGEWNGGDNRSITLPVSGKGVVTVTDTFGDDSAHEVVKVNGVNSISVNIYPNPSTGLFTLSSKANFEVMNIAGKIVLQGNSNSINLTGFSSGMYFAKISTIEETTIKKLIVK